MRTALLIVASLIVAGVTLGIDESGSAGSPIIQPAGPLSPTPVRTWVTDSDVEAIAVVGDTVFAAGYIGYLGPRTGALAVLNRSLRPVAGVPQLFGGGPVEGFVTAIAPDGAGGWIVGGSFTDAGGRACRGLAHITSGNALDPRFCISPNGLVTSIAVGRRTVYFGGEFTNVNGARRLRVAAVDRTFGRLRSWAPAVGGGPYYDRNDVVRPRVAALALHGDVLFIGGHFDRVGGRPRVGIAAVGATSGKALEWRADVGPRGGWSSVRQLHLRGDTIYVVQNILHIDNEKISDVRALDVASARPRSWRSPVRRVDTLLATTRRIYVAGRAGDRSKVIATEPRTGARLKSFDAATVTGEVRGLTLAGNRLVLVGEFGRIGNQRRANVAALHAHTGRTLRWAPHTNAPLHAVASSAGRVALGGTMTSIGGVVRDGLVAFDGRTGALQQWFPKIDGTVSSIAVDAGRLFIGGDFSRVNGSPRAGLAAFDVESKRLLDWAPSVGPRQEFFLVQALTAAGGRVYVAGNFATVNGTPRERLAAIDAESGDLEAWNPGLRGDGVDDFADLTEIAVVGDRVYVAGKFTHVGGVERLSLAEIDARSGRVTPWVPEQDGLYGVTTIVAGESELYIGGDFEHFGGGVRRGLAAVSLETHALLDWAPALGKAWVGPIANDLAVVGSRVVVGGDFRTIADAERAAIALVDRLSGSADAWQPPASERAQYEANAVAVSPTVLAFDGYAGGNADSISIYRFGS